MATIDEARVAEDVGVVRQCAFGNNQLATGALSDRIGRKWLIAAGMWTQAAAIGFIATSRTFQGFAVGLFVLGLGTSGPQVMEGWHGVRFDRPVQRTRETIDIIRTISAGERLAYDGEIYTLPLPGGGDCNCDCTGAGGGAPTAPAGRPRSPSSCMARAMGMRTLPAFSSTQA